MWIKTKDELPVEGRIVMTRSEYGAEIPLYRNGPCWYIKCLREGGQDTRVVYTPIEWKEL